MILTVFAIFVESIAFNRIKDQIRLREKSISGLFQMYSMYTANISSRSSKNVYFAGQNINNSAIFSSKNLSKAVLESLWTQLFDDNKNDLILHKKVRFLTISAMV